MKKATSQLFVLTLVMMISGCSSSKIEYSDIGSEYQLNKKWILESIDGERVSDSEFNSELPWLELKINATVFNGNTGCNSMSGSVYATSTSIIFDNIIHTMIACPGDKEEKLLNVLKATDSWQIERGKLYLKSKRSTLAVFE